MAASTNSSSVRTRPPYPHHVGGCALRTRFRETADTEVLRGIEAGLSAKRIHQDLYRLLHHPEVVTMNGRSYQLKGRAKSSRRRTRSRTDGARVAGFDSTTDTPEVKRAFPFTVPR